MHAGSRLAAAAAADRARACSGDDLAPLLAFLVLLGCCCYDDCCDAWVLLGKNPAARKTPAAAERRRSTGVFSGSRFSLHRAVTLRGGGERGSIISSSAAADGAAVVRTKSPPLSLLDVASSITQESCPLLGIKSLGVDYGLVRTGLAVTVGYQPVPLAILEQPTNSTTTPSNSSSTTNNATALEQTTCWNDATQQVCSSVVAYAQTQQVDRIIVGLPLHKNGTVAEQTNLTLAFGSQLVRTALATLGPRVVVHFFDERYTSKEAAARAHSRNPHNTGLYGTLDADAAGIILENYYEDDGVGAHTLELPEDVRRSCLEQFERRQRREDQQRRVVQEEREAKVRRRKEAIAAARALEEERAANQDAAGAGSTGNKAKRKKKKRKR